MDNFKTLYKLKNWIREHKLHYAKENKYVADGWAREELSGWIKKYGMPAVLKSVQSNIGCQTLRQYEQLLSALKKELETRGEKRKALAKSMEKYN